MIKKLVWYCRRTFLCWTKPNLRTGSKVKFGKGLFVSKKAPVNIGSRFYCGPNCYLSANLTIGDRVIFGGHVAVVGGDHDIDSGTINIIDAGRAIFRETIICDDVWVGHGAIIMQGVTLGKGCVIGSGSVVTRDIPECAIAVGNPAKILRYRKIKG